MRFSVVMSSLAFLLFFESNAYAYLDPGTGSIILQAIIAGVASSIFVVKMYWYKLRSFLGFRNSSSQPSDDQQTR
jgi:hypothetical protein